MDKTSRQGKLQELAKRWRGQEGDLILQMRDLLPYPLEVRSKLGHSDILRLSMAYLKTKQLERELGCTFMDHTDIDVSLASRDGFLISIHQSGLILHVTNHIYHVTGYHEHEVVGSSISQFLHPGDQQEFFMRMRRVFNHSHDDAAPYNILPAPCEFITRFKYKLMGAGNKTKQTGFMSLYVRGYMKTVGRDDCLLLASCFSITMLPGLRLTLYDVVGAIRYDVNQNITHVEDRLNEYYGFDFGDYYRNMDHAADCWHEQDMSHHKHNIINEVLERKGSLMTSFKLLTRCGHLFVGVCVQTAVYGPRGECVAYVSIDYVTRHERVKIKYWPIKNRVLCLPDCVGLVGDNHISLPCRLHQIISSSSSSPESHTDLNIHPTHCLKEDSTLTLCQSSLAPCKHSYSDSSQVHPSQMSSEEIISVTDTHSHHTPNYTEMYSGPTTLTAGGLTKVLAAPDNYNLDLSINTNVLNINTKDFGDMLSDVAGCDVKNSQSLIINSHIPQDDCDEDEASQDIDLLLSGALEPYLTDSENSLPDLSMTKSLMDVGESSMVESGLVDSTIDIHFSTDSLFNDK